MLQSLRRFKKIDGKHLALVISVNLFVALITSSALGAAIAARLGPTR